MKASRIGSSSSDEEREAPPSTKRKNLHASDKPRTKKQTLSQLQTRHVDSSDSAPPSESVESDCEEHHAAASKPKLKWTLFDTSVFLPSVPCTACQHILPFLLLLAAGCCLFFVLGVTGAWDWVL